MWCDIVICHTARDLIRTNSDAPFQLVMFPLPSARQHLSYGDCLEVKREYYQNSSLLDCVTQCSQSTAHLCEQFLQVKQIGFVTLDSHTVCRGGCLELYYNMVEWFWWDLSLISTTNWFLQCFDTVGFGHLACKNRPRNDLLCVEWDVKPYILTHSLTNNLMLRHWCRDGWYDWSRLGSLSNLVDMCAGWILE